MADRMQSLFIRTRRTQRGQTLIIALLILGILLVLGLVFAGLVNRNIVQTDQSRARSAANDLAESGVRYAHYQLANSTLGADWRPEATRISDFSATSDTTRDPDAFYIRQADPNVQRYLDPARKVLDRGGPDGLGPYSRFFFDKGRALVRVRYAPSDFGNFDQPTGNLRQPGKARNYLLIESVGRAGKFKPNDPTFLTPRAIKYRAFATDAELKDALGALAQYDAQTKGSKKMIGFASLGTIETARFITNKFRVSTPAEIGSITDPRTDSTVTDPSADAGLGIRYGEPIDSGRQVVKISNVLGGTAANSAGTLFGTGTLYSNASVVLHGRNDVYMDPRLGDMWAIAGDILPANRASALRLLTPSTDVLLNSGNLDSRNPGFSTRNGILRDGDADPDGDGYGRGITRKEPPSILTTDPTTNLNRFIVLTRESGSINDRGQNTGQYGYGEGIYVSANANERGDAQDENERIALDGSKSLVQAWLNPNKQGGKTGGWNGPFYIPLGAYVRLHNDGFTIIRDSAGNAASSTWRSRNGQDLRRSAAFFKLVNLPDGTYVINDVLSPDLAAKQESQLQGADAGRVRSEGFRFNGTLVFEGDVRVRGIIPTDQQITLVSFGTIYIEGSITKGISTDAGQVLSRPSRSMIALMAKDYVCVNTTQFFGPAPGEQPQTKQAQIVRDTPAAVELDLQAPGLVLQTQFLLNPVEDLSIGSQVVNPQTWKPFANNYVEAGSSRRISSSMLIQHAADDGGPSFLNLGFQPDDQSRAFTPYKFESYSGLNTEILDNFNSEIRRYLGPGAGKVFSDFYGLTRTDINAFPSFETLSVPLVSNSWNYTTGGFRQLLTAPAGNTNGIQSFGVQTDTAFRLQMTGFQDLTGKNYELARVAVVPHDIRIEAAIFAEEGSFFVIPGPPFNVNNRDTREAFMADVRANSLVDAQRNRYRNFGSMPESPFYNEPLSVRITIVGAVAENMPAPMAQQAEWQRKWGWMPRKIGGTEVLIPKQWLPRTDYDVTGDNPANYWIPNLTVNYDPALALGTNDVRTGTPIRTSPDGLWTLPPLPRLPVSPSLAYFGEVNP